MKALTLYKAETFFERLQGLLLRKPLDEHEALLIKPCSDIHSIGMKYSIDVAFIDNAGLVLKVVCLKPNRFARCHGSKSVIEFKAGCAVKHGVETGAHIQIAEFSSPLTGFSIGERV